MTNSESKFNYSSKKLDLEERTAAFGEAITLFVKSVPKDIATVSILNQLIRSGTSVGANYCEANDAESRKDFIHKLGIVRKEAHETKHWLRMIAVAEPSCIEQARKLWQEAKELNLIFSAVIRSSKSNLNSSNEH